MSREIGLSIFELQGFERVYREFRLKELLTKWLIGVESDHSYSLKSFMSH